MLFVRITCKNKQFSKTVAKLVFVFFCELLTCEIINIYIILQCHFGFFRNIRNDDKEILIYDVQ